MATWDWSDRWRTWWFHPDREPIRCDGHENGHWRHMEANPALVTNACPESGAATFSAYVAGNDVGVDCEDDAREVMKFWVHSDGYVRCGLSQATSGYVDGMSMRAIRQAAAFLMDRSGGALDRLAVTVVPTDWGAYRESEFREEWIDLRGAEIDRFIRRGTLPRPMGAPSRDTGDDADRPDPPALR